MSSGYGPYPLGGVLALARFLFESCRPSGSRDSISFQKPQIDLFSSKEGTDGNRGQASVYHSLCAQLTATDGNGFGSFEPFSGGQHLPPVATVCDPSAP